MVYSKDISKKIVFKSLGLNVNKLQWDFDENKIIYFVLNFLSNKGNIILTDINKYLKDRISLTSNQILLIILLDIFEMKEDTQKIIKNNIKQIFNAFASYPENIKNILIEKFKKYL